MAGILDKKERIFDSIITKQGRQQMAAGRLLPELASVSDIGAFYQHNKASGSSDASVRLYFEARSKKQDMITLETDDVGNLLGQNLDSDFTILGKSIFVKGAMSYTGSMGGARTNVMEFLYASGSGDFASLSHKIVSSSISHFDNQFLIGTRNEINFGTKPLVDSTFTLSHNTVTFIIENNSPWPTGPDDATVNLSDIEPFWFDKRLSHEPYFKFLPPLVKDPSSGRNYKTPPIRKSYPEGPFLGTYTPLNTMTKFGYSDFIREVDGIDNWSQGISYDALIAREYPFTSRGSFHSDMVEMFEGSSGDGVISSEEETYFTRSALIKAQSKDIIEDYGTDPVVPREHIHFTNTSLDNNIIMQMYEVDLKTKELTKLDTIDRGESMNQDTVFDSKVPKRTFFAGKVFIDQTNGVPSYVNLFSIVLD